MAALTDLFLYDLKLIDDAKHRHYTGVSNALILDNLQALGRVHGRIWLRVPIIPGINDDPANLEAAARFAATVPGVQQVNLLAVSSNRPAQIPPLGPEQRPGRSSTPFRRGDESRRGHLRQGRFGR